MSVNCCGRSCTECIYYENRECPGCDQKMNKEITSDCKIAKCCIENCYDSCRECSFQKGCPLTGRKEKLNQGAKLPKKPYAPLTLKTESYSAMLSKWLVLLCWLMIPVTGATVLISKASLLQSFLGLGIGKICFAAFSILYALVLMIMSKASAWYRYTAIGYIAGVVMTLVAFNAEGSGVMEVFALLAQAAVIIGTQYLESKTQADIVRDVDGSLSDKWRKIWIWYTVGWAALLLDAVILLFIPFVGMIFYLVVSVEMLVMMIVKMVMIGKSAKAFRRDAQLHHA